MTDAVIIKITAPAPAPILRINPATGDVLKIRDSSVIATPEEIGAYTKQEVDTLVEGVRAQTAELVFQFPTPALTWAIRHNLGRLRPSITIVDTAGEQIWTDILPQDANTAVATFAAPTAGTAYVN